MFAFLRGTLAGIDTNTAVIDVNGVGFKLGMSNIALTALAPIGSTVTVFTLLIVRDDSLDLYGFIDSREREFFERLIAVSGVGPKVALSALSTFNPDTLMSLIIEEDVKRLTTVSGLGKKTAQRLILELKGTLAAMDEPVTGAAGQISRNSVIAQVTEALLGMGFTRQEIEVANRNYSGQESVEERMRYALQRLGGA